MTTLQSALTTDIALIDHNPHDDHGVREILEHLHRSPAQLPCKLFYDQRGSELFDQICELPEYYPTRTELAIMRDALPEISQALGSNLQIIEFGSGSSLKTRHLLESLDQPSAYIPVEISRSALDAAAKRLQQHFPELRIAPVVADYTRPFDLPKLDDAPKLDTQSKLDMEAGRRVVYFPGSTLGNFPLEQARSFLRDTSKLVGVGGGMLLGLDLKKPLDVLLPAYDDAQGVTAAFNKNILRHVNHLAQADFQLDGFDHRAVWDSRHDRVEMHLVSNRDQVVSVAGQQMSFGLGDVIWTESSHKYSLKTIDDLVSPHWQIDHIWTDPQQWFALVSLTAV